jgi:hypothetical protein
MRLIRWVAVAAVLAAGLLFVSAASAHIRYGCGYEYNPTGLCTYFNGDTTDSPGGNRVDPINIIWYPGGLWEWRIWSTFNAIGWNDTCGGGQYNWRLVGPPGGEYWDWVSQIGQRATGGCPGSRFHARVFRGHNHQDDSLDWSISDAHQEDWNHDIVSWEYAEDTLRGAAEGAGRGGEAAWQYLPRGEGWIQGQYSNGWADRIAPW